MKALDRVHDQYMAEGDEHRDKVPILAVQGKEAFGRAVAPVLRLQGWAPRPADLPDKPPYKRMRRGTGTRRSIPPTPSIPTTLSTELSPGVGGCGAAGPNSPCNEDETP